ncbi:MAG: iron-sulfur cluster assembly accessory protein [Myxococcota bacterium]
MLTVTERAAEKALNLAERDGKPPVLRIGVRGGGCSGMSYFMDFDQKGPRETDHRLEVASPDGETLTVLVDPKSMKFLDETQLDFETKILAGGFKFNNPRAKRSCSCGESFTV